ncbi:MAG: DUF4157 domain-containing protein [Thermoleophilia bacterium]|nr:DUF4157 domain-containing protein [Thermoleophilia bacterium]
MQALLDPLQPPGPNGWTPANVVAVSSKDGNSFLSSAVKFIGGGVDEKPGQRLSTAQVDALAPYYASVFHIDERRVRDELAKVYLYVGGPAASSGQAMTVGHHIFMPDKSSLDSILSPGNKRWLSHELVHTMQFVNYDGGSSHGFLSSYVRSMIVGRDPEMPGAGGGPMVWGALFTGWRTSTKGYSTTGKPTQSMTGRLGFSVAPAALLSIPVALTAGGGLAAARATIARAPGLEGHNMQLLGGMRSVPTAMALIAAPALLGSVAGVYADKIGNNTAQTLGAVAGGGVALATLGAAKAFSRSGTTGALRGWATTAAAIGAVVGATAIGWSTAHVSANTIRGWSRNADLLRAHLKRESETPSFQDGLHDSHWEEIEAEAIAQAYVAGERPAVGADAYKGVAPQSPSSGSKRLDWGLWNPLTLGIPLAGVVGGGVIATRTGVTLLDSSLRDGKAPLAAVKAALTELRSDRKGFLNSLSIGGALTVAPLMVGGIVAPIAASMGIGATGSRIAGAGASAAVTGIILTGLLRGRGGRLLTTTPKVLGGMAVAAGVGLLSAGLAYDATRSHERKYDDSAGAHA